MRYEGIIPEISILKAYLSSKSLIKDSSPFDIVLVAVCSTNNDNITTLLFVKHLVLALARYDMDWSEPLKLDTLG